LRIHTISKGETCLTKTMCTSFKVVANSKLGPSLALQFMNHGSIFEDIRSMVHKVVQKSKRDLKNLVARTVTRSRIHTEDTQNLVARTVVRSKILWYVARSILRIHKI